MFSEKEKINEAKYCERKNLSEEGRKSSFSDMQVGSYFLKNFKNFTGLYSQL